MMDKVAIADFHHQVLIPWAGFRRKSDTVPAVLTLDHHTDVVRAFRNDSRTVEDGSWRDAGCVAAAVDELKHDEHFDWAVRSGTVREIWIASHTNATEPADERLHICCDPGWREENDLFREPELFRPLADSVLESSYLFRQFGDLAQYGRFILDIDCDYILTARALEPEDPEYFNEMLRRAELVTVSLESDWVRLLRFRGEDISGEIVSKRILERCRSLS